MLQDKEERRDRNSDIRQRKNDDDERCRERAGHLHSTETVIGRQSSEDDGSSKNQANLERGKGT